jgi:hypothetical protein
MNFDYKILLLYFCATISWPSVTRSVSDLTKRTWFDMYRGCFCLYHNPASSFKESVNEKDV